MEKNTSEKENPNSALEESQEVSEKQETKSETTKEEENPNSALEEPIVKGEEDTAKSEASGEKEASDKEKSELEDEKSGEEKESSKEDLAGEEEEGETILETLVGKVFPDKELSSIKPKLCFLGIVLIVTIVLSVVICSLVLRQKKKKEKQSVDRKGNNNDGNSNGTAKIMKASKKCPVTVASMHGIGMRSSQQDSFGLSDLVSEDCEEKGVFAVVADGMGGLTDGDKVSRMVVITMLEGFDEDNGKIPPSSLLLKLVHEANEEVCGELGEEKLGKCGSTLVAAIVKDRKLSWISVGDSHLYVLRNGQLVKLNTDHNYAVELDNMARSGEISLEEALRDPQRGALTSFIGKGSLELVDQNEAPILLEKGDKVLLMSDGVFGTVPESRIAEIMMQPLLEGCVQLEQEILEENRANQDNYTCVVMDIK